MQLGRLFFALFFFVILFKIGVIHCAVWVIFADQFIDMTISYKWLSQYLPVQLEPQDLSEILTSLGLEVEHMALQETVKGGLQGLLIGKVTHCETHPNADKLSLTKVDIGQQDLLSIVCGAPNVAAGQTVVVAPVGCVIHPLKGDSFEIRKAKIRGEESQGMICAEDEIGLGESHDGILILPDHLQAGTKASDYFQIPEPDYIYEIGLTPNRMDAMSHLGVARDVCAYLSHHRQQSFEAIIPNVDISTDNTNPAEISVEIQDATRCARYSGLLIKNIQVGESPEWLKQQLKSIGLRPINQIVDITNFVLHECGQPLHAFDFDKIRGGKIQVKTLANDTSFIALDGQTIQLCNDDLMICDSEGGMCIAGVYGGLHSGVQADTQNIFLESAWFQPESIRKTSMRYQLRTDAATRFEKGADINQVIYALKRAAGMILEMAGGEISGTLIDLYPQPKPTPEVQISYSQIHHLSGKKYSEQTILQILKSLRFEILHTDTEGILVGVPSSKSDISLPADIVEEIMRVDGLDQIAFPGKLSYTMPDPEHAFRSNIKRQVSAQLVAKGFYEMFTNSITNAAYYPERNDLVQMMNSLSANLDVMRPSMLETGLESMAYNFNRRNQHLKFFEFGKVYTRQDEKFQETEMLALFVSATVQLPHWSMSPRQADIYYLRGLIEALFPQLVFVFEEMNSGLNILYRNQPIGQILQVSLERLKQMDIKQEVWYAELNWTILKKALEQTKVVFQDIPKFPVVWRDLSLVVDKKVAYADIQKAVRQAKSKLLREVNLFDIFESEKLGKDKISYALNFSFYDQQKTLTDAEIESEMSVLLKSLQEKVGASIRN